MKRKVQGAQRIFLSQIHTSERRGSEAQVQQGRPTARSGARTGTRARAARHVRLSERRPEPLPRPAEETISRFSIRTRSDILEARERARSLAAGLGFSLVDRVLITSAISELGRNMIACAGRGDIRVEAAGALDSETSDPAGIVIVASDQGPGMGGLRGTMQESSGCNLGLGLAGVKRIMDEFDIVSKPMRGTTVTVKKWKLR